MSRLFSFSENGLSYSVRIFEVDGQVRAEITVLEGSMDVNAIYTGDDDFSGPSASLSGPLNMNGAGSRFEGEQVQWDDAIPLSRPGLGREGTDKETFLQEGESLTVDLNVDSIEDVDFVGIRATSVNGGGSIKGVLGNPEIEEPEDQGDPEEPTDPEEPGDAATYEKVFFAETLSDTGFPISGLAINAEEPDPNVFNVPFLPEDTEPTFANYVAAFEDLGGDPSSLSSVIFYEDSEELTEFFRIDAPEGGFEDTEALLAAYETAVAGMELDAETAGMFVEVDFDEIMPADALVDEPDEDYVI